MHRFNLRETSEKTTEINVLSDVTSFIEQHSQRKVTIIAPTQNDEKDLGFDEIIEDLPFGRTIALQFKRPYCLPSIKECTRFYIDTNQLGKLLDNFSPREAYYVFVPYPFTSDFIHNRLSLLHDSITVDPYDIPNARKTSQQTRTLRYYHNVCARGRCVSRIEIADPRVYESVEKTNAVMTICKRLIEGEIGVQTPLSKDIPRPKIEKRKHPSKLFYVHLSSDNQSNERYFG